MKNIFNYAMEIGIFFLSSLIIGIQNRILEKNCLLSSKGFFFMELKFKVCLD